MQKFFRGPVCVSAMPMPVLMSVERGGGDTHGSRSANDNGNPAPIGRHDMFAELGARVEERDRRRETLDQESKQKAAETGKMQRELVEKVGERDRRVANSAEPTASTPPAVTIIKKNNARKFLVDSASAATAVAASFQPPGDGSQDSPFGNPLRTSTPSTTAQNVDPPAGGETGDVLGDDNKAVEQMSSSGSDSNSAYIDIDTVDDIESLVNAGVVPSVSKSLKDEISLCWQNLQQSHSSEFQHFSSLTMCSHQQFPIRTD